MNLTDFVPIELFPTMRDFGPHDWLSFENHGKGIQVINNLEQFFPQIPAHIGRFLFENTGKTILIRAYCASKCLTNGPKLLKPGYQECIALEHVALEIPFADYKQPYPTLLVEFPNEYRRDLTKRFNFECPLGVMLHHEETRSGHIFTFGDEKTNPKAVFANLLRPENQTIEQVLQAGHSPDEDRDLQQGEILQRVAMNLALMLTLSGCKEMGSADSRNLQKMKQKLRKARKQDQPALRHKMKAIPTVITFSQNVDFCLVRGNSHEQKSTHASSPKKAHWRRGHYRMQRVGQGRTKEKLTFIKPVLVNPHYFEGDKSETSVEYRGKSLRPTKEVLEKLKEISKA